MKKLAWDNLLFLWQESEKNSPEWRYAYMLGKLARYGGLSRREIFTWHFKAVIAHLVDFDFVSIYLNRVEHSDYPMTISFRMREMIPL